MQFVHSTSSQGSVLESTCFEASAKQAPEPRHSQRHSGRCIAFTKAAKFCIIPSFSHSHPLAKPSQFHSCPSLLFEPHPHCCFPQTALDPNSHPLAAAMLTPRTLLDLTPGTSHRDMHQVTQLWYCVVSTPPHPPLPFSLWTLDLAIHTDSLCVLTQAFLILIKRWFCARCGMVLMMGNLFSWPHKGMLPGKSSPRCPGALRT